MSIDPNTVSNYIGTIFNYVSSDGNSSIVVDPTNTGSVGLVITHDITTEMPIVTNLTATGITSGGNTIAYATVYETADNCTALFLPLSPEMLHVQTEVMIDTSYNANAIILDSSNNFVTISDGTIMSKLTPSTFQGHDLDLSGNVVIDGTVTMHTAPAMSGASISANTIPAASLVNSSISDNQILSAGISQSSIQYGYTDLSSNQTIQGIKTFDSSPVMSGSSISANTIPAASLVNSSISDSQIVADGISQSSVSNGYIDLTSNQNVAGIKLFSNVVQCSSAPTLPDDLINLQYLLTYPPPSSVVFYFNQTLTPPTSIPAFPAGYKELGGIQDALPQSTLVTTIPQMSTDFFVNAFANTNYLLGIGSFIPNGLWDMNLFCNVNDNSAIPHVSVLWRLYGIDSSGIEHQLGGDSSISQLT